MRNIDGGTNTLTDTNLHSDIVLTIIHIFIWMSTRLRLESLIYEDQFKKNVIKKSASGFINFFRKALMSHTFSCYEILGGAIYCTESSSIIMIQACMIYLFPYVLDPGGNHDAFRPRVLHISAAPKFKPESRSANRPVC